MFISLTPVRATVAGVGKNERHVEWKVWIGYGPQAFCNSPHAVVFFLQSSWHCV